MWQDYQRQPNTVHGELKWHPDFYSPQLQNHRDILLLLPPSYHQDEARRYPVLYMHDGQNLFDAYTSFAGEWQVDEALQELSREGLEAIVVGIPNMGEERIREYNPYHHPHFGAGRGEGYLRFLVESLKPNVDAHFRTLPGRAHTGIMGSSMGGHISLYAFFRYPQVFGMMGAMSPAFWIARRRLAWFVQRAPYLPGRLYLDVGTLEQKPPLVGGLLTRQYRSESSAITGMLIRKGYRPQQELLYIEDEGGRHQEADWARRLPAALRFLLGKTA